MNKDALLPAVWLLVMIVGLPQLSETVYTPSLPEIATFLKTSVPLVEHTLSIYLFGFALGTFFWGKLSDRHGRKPCLLAGLVIFMVACIGCYASTSIEMLLFCRFVQGFAGSTCSVLGQSICRDAFHGLALGRVYSMIGSSMALFPALGPVCGGFIAEHLGWAHVFSFLTLFTLMLFGIVALRLPETHAHEARQKHALLEVAKKLFTNRYVWGFGIMVAGCNGLSFSYFAEGPFFLIHKLGLTPSVYGMSFMLIGLGGMLGGLYSKHLQAYMSGQAILTRGLWVILATTALFSGLVLMHTYGVAVHDQWLVAAAIANQAICLFAICAVTSNALALALVDFKWCIGTASSLFGLFYYALISTFNFGMGVLHNGTLLPMPLYFFSIAVFMLVIDKWLLTPSK